jgi:hypothetical protein
MSTFGYEGPHQRSMRVVKLRMGGDRTVGTGTKLTENLYSQPIARWVYRNDRAPNEYSE